MVQEHRGGFDWQAFSSEAKFRIWFIKHNEAGDGLAGWVNIISIEALSAADHVDTTQWLTEIPCSMTIGMKGSIDVTYTTHYPTIFVGASKDQILS
jgi:hypothetical protein